MYTQFTGFMSLESAVESNMFGCITSLLVKKYTHYNDEDSHDHDLTMRYPPNHRYYKVGDDEFLAYEQYESDDDAYAADLGKDEVVADDDTYVADNNRLQKETCHSSATGDKIAQNDIEPMTESNFNGGDRNMNVYSVRSPVENLIQWRKAIQESSPVRPLRSPIENRLWLRKATKASTVENLRQWTKAINAGNESKQSKQEHWCIQ
ncbi:unnamed protein product [Lupinus luteus]|uniref:Uncharacterized protein n=1 Tax=Lupinus luteus TaxID=3873 RepID=A0AAV1W282_LUPLU